MTRWSRTLRRNRPRRTRKRWCWRLVEQLDKGGKGAAWDDIVAEARKSGIEREELDEISNSLLDKGLVYEPVLGKMKVI